MPDEAEARINAKITTQGSVILTSGYGTVKGKRALAGNTRGGKILPTKARLLRQKCPPHARPFRQNFPRKPAFCGKSARHTQGRSCKISHESPPFPAKFPTKARLLRKKCRRKTSTPQKKRSPMKETAIKQTDRISVNDLRGNKTRQEKPAAGFRGGS